MGFNKSKIDGFEKTDMEDELIDVLIVLLLTAKSLWMDQLDEAILRKIEKNNKRGY